MPYQQTAATSATFGTQAGAAAGFAWFLVVLAAPNFLLDPTPLDQLAEAAHRFLDRFPIPKRQFNHISSFSSFC
ncbi:MAG: hypothetical protein A2W31_00375 [Planctomycetes bacterium RBG_16_64_10]|nr:MAG: hypothetical protein A2W31_00375 [Planctomycetes bacterium RBG_16_64_10]